MGKVPISNPKNPKYYNVSTLIQTSDVIARSWFQIPFFYRWYDDDDDDGGIFFLYPFLWLFLVDISFGRRYVPKLQLSDREFVYV